MEFTMIDGHQISKELCDALGLPKLTRGFTLRCYVGEPVTVECEYYPASDFQLALARYRLIAVGGDLPTPSPKPFNFDAWLRDRTESAHREFMGRTSRRLPCDWTTEEIARYFRVPLEQLE
jgi:hypothetical protein